MVNIVSAVSNIMTEFSQVVMVFTVAIALLQCFFGYRLLKIWVAIIGFLLGFALGFGISVTLMKGEAYIPAVIGIVAGILLALVSFKLYLVGVFLFCGFIAFGAVRTIPVPDEAVWKTVLIVLAVVAFVVAGILAVKFSRPCIIAITAVSGAFHAVHGLQTFVPVLASNPALGMVTAIVIAALGIAVQFITTKEEKGRRKF